MNPEGARHGLHQLQLRPRSQPPGQDYQGREDGGLLPEDAALPAELGTVPRVALLPAGRFLVQRKSADRGILNGSQNEPAKRNTGGAEGDEDREAAPHGPRCMDPADPATRNSRPTLTK